MQIVSFVIWTLPGGLPSTSNFIVHVNPLDASEITDCSIYLNSIAIVFQECGAPRRYLQKNDFCRRPDQLDTFDYFFETSDDGARAVMRPQVIRSQYDNIGWL